MRISDVVTSLTLDGVQVLFTLNSSQLNQCQSLLKNPSGANIAFVYSWAQVMRRLSTDAFNLHYCCGAMRPAESFIFSRESVVDSAGGWDSDDGANGMVRRI